MKYVANPVIVDAFEITEILPNNILTLKDGGTAYPTPEMLSRITPVVGDYWVIQEDGYVYLNPKEVFERKYTELCK